MIYCAHCKKPSARESGPCPHCGQNLTGAQEVANLEPVQEHSEESARNEFEFDDSSSGDLELAADDYQPPIEGQAHIPPGPVQTEKSDDGPQLQMIESVPPPARPMAASVARDIEDGEIRHKAAFGSPPEGFMDVIRYGFTVRGRLKILDKEKTKVCEDQTVADERLEVLRAELGREAREFGLTNDAMEHLVSHAAKMDSHLESMMARKAGMASEPQETLRRLDLTIKELEAQAAPVRVQDEAASLKLDAARTDQKRVDAKVKRAQIELRNTAELIEKKQAEFADLEKPKEERDALLAQIAELDKKQPEMKSRIKAHQAELDELHAPVTEAQAVLDEIRARLGALSERLVAIKKEREQLVSIYSQTEGNVAREMDEEKRSIQKAWSAVGERVVAEGVAQDHRLFERAKVILTATETSAGLARKVDLHTRAADSYDKRAYRRSNTAVIGILAGLGVIIVAAIAIATI